MIGLKENEVVGTVMDTIRARFGQGKTEKLVNAILAVDKLDDLEGEYRDMVRYGIENTDYTTGRPRKRARTRKAVSYLEKRGGHFLNGEQRRPKRPLCTMLSCASITLTMMSADAFPAKISSVLIPLTVESPNFGARTTA